MIYQCNTVFEGGGVRGIGHVGAACTLYESGFRFQNFVGSSAGAIVASLLACGYTPNELKLIIENLDYKSFRQESGLTNYLGAAGKLISLLNRFGIYNTDYFENWLSELLLKKNKLTFADLKNGSSKKQDCNYRLQVTASDVTSQRLLILPRDLSEFGIEPDSFSIAKAVRMSMSIPLFYKPYRLRDQKGKIHLIVDGGLLSNYPVWLFDTGCSYNALPTIGFKFIDDCSKDSVCHSNYSKYNFLWYLKTLVSTALDAADKQHISVSRGDFARTVTIPVSIDIDGAYKKISATDFDITKQESSLLYQNGIRAGEQFIKQWDYNTWKANYR